MMLRYLIPVVVLGASALSAFAQGARPYDDRGRPNPDAFDWTGFALGANVGTLGAGVDATVYLAPSLNFRASGSVLPFNVDDRIEDIDFDLDLDFTTVRFLLDYFPQGNDTFRISFGLVYADNTIGLLATPSESEKIGDNEYTPEEIGTLNGSLEFDEWSPYLGIGFGNAVRPDMALSAAVDIGVMFQQYSTDVTADGALAGTPVFERDLAELEEDIDDGLDGFKIYPVITISLSYHF